jgi:hypothetical protein
MRTRLAASRNIDKRYHVEIWTDMMSAIGPAVSTFDTLEEAKAFVDDRIGQGDAVISEILYVKEFNNNNKHGL